MVGKQLFVLIIAVFSITVDANSNEYCKVQKEKCATTSRIKVACVDNVLPIHRLNFNGLCFQDAPSGVDDSVQCSTAFPPDIPIATT
ncbi:unnamed protein product [Rotaria sordida]|uniref:Uncharacterized protein n=1 Tax=Rotaria sordida TaxID=392033 RepID=A0A819HAX1_9BILA|nr:unnamed protein product [Rotaria sordida]CAF3900665.1 unnamed protein product [Rotaria sordida]